MANLFSGLGQVAGNLFDMTALGQAFQNAHYLKLLQAQQAMRNTQADQFFPQPGSQAPMQGGNPYAMTSGALDPMNPMDVGPPPVDQGPPQGAPQGGQPNIANAAGNALWREGKFDQAYGAVKPPDPHWVQGSGGDWANSSASEAPAHQMNLQNVNGFNIDQNDANNTNRFLPKIADGATPLYDQNRNVVAQKLLDGTIQAISATEQAKAQAGANVKPYVDTTGPAPILTTEGAVAGAVGTGSLPPGVGGPPRGGVPRGLRDNNPLNLTPNANFAGIVGKDGPYAQFGTPEAGWTAAEQNLLARVKQHGLGTVADIIGAPGVGWAPAGAPGNSAASTGNYVNTVASALGVSPQANIGAQIVTNPTFRRKMLEAMAGVELGRPATFGGGTAPPPSSGPPKGPQGIRGVNQDDLKAVRAAEAAAEQKQTLANLAQDFMKVSKDFGTGPALGPVNLPLVGNVNPIPGYMASTDKRLATLDSINNRAWVMLRPTGSGPLRAYEATGFKTAFPNKLNLGQANQNITEQLVREAQIAKADTAARRAYLLQNGSLDGYQPVTDLPQGGGGAPQGRSGMDFSKMTDAQLHALAGH